MHPDSPDAPRWRLIGLRVENLRALHQHETAELRRLTVLLGSNGIGKSTLIRLMPLLRQSTGDRGREPLLWWTSHGAVDFGSFSEAVREGQEKIRLTFRFDRGPQGELEAWTELEATPNGGSRVARAGIREGGDELCLEFPVDGGALTTEGSCAGVPLPRDANRLGRLPTQPWRLFGVAADPTTPEVMITFTRDLFHPRTGDAKAAEMLLSLRDWSSPEQIWHGLYKANRTDQHRKSLKSRQNDQAWLRHVQALRFSWHAVEQLRTAEDQIERLGRTTAYLGPFRAIPLRSYRAESVAVEGLDQQGANLAMFLLALTPTELADLNRSLQRSLQVELELSPTGQGSQIRVRRQGKTYNLLDMGFGYSQVLPVAVQLWACRPGLSTRRSMEDIEVVALEQPELHLHPRQQASVARILAEKAMEPDGPLLLVETHSDHLVSELGRLVARGRLDADRLGLLCVEPRQDGEGVTTRLASFNRDGEIENWPEGFLSSLDD